MVRHVAASLPVWEQTTYWVVGVSGILYGIYRVHLTSMDLKPSLQYVETGWDILGGSQDVADYEWYVYSTHLCWRFLPMLVLHIVSSQCLRRLRVTGSVKKMTYLAIGATSACYLYSWRFLMLLTLTTVAFYLLSSLQCVYVVWTLSIAVLYLCNSHPQYVIDLLEISSSVDYFVIIYVWASVFLRCTCFGIERVWSLKKKNSSSISSSSSSSSSSSVLTSSLSTSSLSSTSLSSAAVSQAQKQRQKSLSSFAFSSSKQKTNNSTCSKRKQNGCPMKTATHLYGWPVMSKVPDLLDIFVYIFYVPLLFIGPPVPFMTFKKQIENPASLSYDRCLSIVWKFLRVCFWFVFNHVMLHVVFFGACGQDAPAMQAADKWTVATTAYLIGQFMTNKYVVIYGAMTQCARLDGLELADNPACISYIYAYTDMWKSFDRGLHHCLKRYVYIPLGGSQSGWLRTEVATLAVFCFIGYWHGGGYRYMMWALLNFVEVNLELLGAALNKVPVIQQVLVSRLSATWLRRLKALLTYPLFLVATTSNMYFLAGAPFAEIYLSRVCLQWDSFLTLGLVTYCMTHNSQHLEKLGHTKFA